MNKELQRIKIAEACGVKPEFVEWWAYKDDDTGGRICMSNVDKSVVEKWIADNPEYAKGYVAKPYYRYPRYDEDLNAMHEAENVLTEEQRIAYTNHTYDVACKVQRDTEKWRWISLTAAQRAEAFLKTLGLWEEES